MRRYAVEHGPEIIPKQAYPIWLQLREILTEQSDLVLLTAEAKSVTGEEGSEEELLSLESQEKTYGTNDPVLTYTINAGSEDWEKRSEHIYDSPYEEEGQKERKNEKHKKEKKSIKEVGKRAPASGGKEKAFLEGNWDDDDLSPGDWDGLEEQAAHYHDDDDLVFPVKRKQERPATAPRRKYLPPVGFAGAMAEAREKGDLSFAFPVVYTGNSDDEDAPIWEPLPLKTLKELQLAVKTMGPSAPYTIQVVEMVASQWLTPHDWHQTARATLSPGDYILWRTEYEEKSKETVQKAAGRRGAKVSLDMLLGTGNFLAPSAQVKIPKKHPTGCHDKRCPCLEGYSPTRIKKDCFGRN